MSVPSTSVAVSRTPSRLDPRGPRFGAAVSTIILVLALILRSPWLLAVQVALFAVGAFAGPGRTPQAWLFRTAIRPRLIPPAYFEDATGPRFAQQVGFAITTLALVFVLAGLSLPGWVLAGIALIAAFLNAAFDLCLACLLMPRLRQWRYRLIGS